MSLRGKATIKKPGGKLSLKKIGNVGKKALGAIGGLSGLSGGGRMYRRRRSRGITARQFSNAQRVLKKIMKMYQKLPRRAAHHTTCGKRR